MAKTNVGRLQNCDASSGAMIGWQTPPLTTSFSHTTTSLASVQDLEGDASDPSPRPRKRRKVAYHKSPPSAPGPGLECDIVPDIPETDLPALQQVWSRARVVMPKDSRTPGTSITSISKTWGTYTSRIFKHRSIRYRQDTNNQVLFITDVKENKEEYKGDLVLEDEDEGSAGTLDRVIRSLKHRIPNERTWEAELYYPHFCPQTCETPVGSASDPPTAIRLLQHPMKTILRVPDMSSPYYASFPPIVSAVDRRLTEDNANTPPPWIIPIKEGKVVNDIVYAVNDRFFWTNILNGEWRELVRAKLAGYNLFADSDDMLPYLLVEDKRHEGLNNNGLDYAKAYLILIAASLLHQRLKLRALGKMHTTLKTPGLVVHCIAMAGTEAHYLRVGLRGPASTLPDSTDMYFVRYEGEVRGVFNLMQWKQRNYFKSLLRTIHAFGSGIHHNTQKEEVVNALSTLNAEANDFESILSTSGVTRSKTIMSNNTAFHCVPTPENGGDYILQYTDMTINSQADDGLDASEGLLDPNDQNNSDAGTRDLVSSSIGSVAGEGRTRRQAIPPESQMARTNPLRKGAKHPARRKEAEDEP